MKAKQQPAAPQAIRLELLRDETRVIDRKGGDLKALQKAIDKSRRLRQRIPQGLVDSVGEVRAVRDSGGRV